MYEKHYKQNYNITKEICIDGISINIRSLYSPVAFWYIMEEIIYCDWENIMNIPFKALSDRLKNNSDECKNTKAYNNNIVSYAFLGILAKIINRFENCT